MRDAIVEGSACMIALFLPLRAAPFVGSFPGVPHLAVELAYVSVTLWALAVDTDPVRLWADCGPGWFLVTLAWIDSRHLRLPDLITISLSLLGLTVASIEVPEDVTANAIGTLIGYLGFRTLDCAYRTLRGCDGLAPSDAKLLAAAGSRLRWIALPHIILLAAILGIVIALAGEMWRGRLDAAAMIPFGPCLAISIWIVRLYGPTGERLIWYE
jgi:leader peptidase (prepilin peptidase)/N-methyltransferase